MTLTNSWTSQICLLPFFPCQGLTERLLWGFDVQSSKIGNVMSKMQVGIPSCQTSTIPFSLTGNLNSSRDRRSRLQNLYTCSSIFGGGQQYRYIPNPNTIYNQRKRHWPPSLDFPGDLFLSLLTY
ncbi:hypothetical protein BDD12DRAFT_833279 [Trichophaea hybrida]|nr:hypothetical protein BDD12DRAFT_833279 [Trichophaea hybrida]